MSRPRRKRRVPLPLPKRLRQDPPPVPYLFGRAEVFGDLGDGAAAAIQGALAYALQGIAESDMAWDPGHVLVVVSSATHEQTAVSILPTAAALAAAPWLDEPQRQLVREELPIDQRRVVLWVEPGHIATVKYLVPGGRTSN